MEPAAFGEHKPVHIEDQPGVSIRCPACRTQGTFVAVPNARDVHNSSQKGSPRYRRVGLRFCPGDTCHQVVMVVLGNGRELLSVSPAEIRDFDMTGIPSEVAECLEEALHCESIGAYRAAALMVRRTLEELCHERQATGPTLKTRIEKLGEQIVLPKRLLDGMDHLRLLGNDAAHVEARDYQDVSKVELDAALQVTRVIMHATYQLDHAVGMLESLRRLDEVEG